MRLLLRADGSRAGGVGHVQRCLALAEQAQARGHEVLLVGELTADWAREQAERSGVALQTAPSNWAELVSVARDWAADVVHVDDYQAPGDLRERLRSAGLLLSNVEDGAWGRRVADVTIDPTPGAELTSRPDDGSGTVLRGRRLLLVRASVRRARVRRSARGAVDRTPELVVVMGGTDATGVLGRVLRAVVAADRSARVLAVGPDGIDLAALGISATAKTEIIPSGPRSDLPDVMADADLVVSAAGTTAWELCCMGVPMAIVPVADNQRPGYDALVAAGAAVGLVGPERLDDLAPLRLAALLDDRAVREAMGETGLELVDGAGTARLVAVFEDAVEGSGERPGPSRTTVGVRPAVRADAVSLLEWRNDPATRRWSRETEAVDPSAHRSWLVSSLQARDRHLLVAEDDAAAPVGTLRWDAVPGDSRTWEVSITLAPDQRGRGMAQPVLRTAETWLVSSELGARELLAFVHPDNVASARLFERAGYVLDRPADASGFVGYRKPVSEVAEP